MKKTCFITGAKSGIGLEAAIQIAKKDTMSLLGVEVYQEVKRL
ncbi:hypothetical protein [Anaerosacchariphilus polymeriproducens]|nr:hypothetical protein [Anaerosacchariphilus polymeriproducens]